MVVTILFRIADLYNAFKDRYRALYFAFKYKEQIELSDSVRMAKGTSVSMVYDNKLSFLKISNRSSFRKFCTLTLDGESRLEIGSDNFFNNGCSISCLGNITIGNHNLFGEGIKIYDHNHVFTQSNELIMKQGFKIGIVKIGNNCWIGSNCVILNNVIIGDNVVIGANNLIYKSISDNTIVKAVFGFDIRER